MRRNGKRENTFPIVKFDVVLEKKRGGKVGNISQENVVFIGGCILAVELETFVQKIVFLFAH